MPAGHYGRPVWAEGGLFLFAALTGLAEKNKFVVGELVVARGDHSASAASGGSLPRSGFILKVHPEGTTGTYGCKSLQRP